MYSMLKRFEYPGFLRKFSQVQWLPWASRDGRSSADQRPWEKPYRGELKGITLFADFTDGLFERAIRTEVSRLLNRETGHSVLLVEFLKEGGDYELTGNAPISVAWAKVGNVVNKKSTTGALAVGTRIGDEVDWRWYPPTTAPDMWKSYKRMKAAERFVSSSGHMCPTFP